MSDEAHSGADDGPQKVYGWRYQNGATIQREAEFTAGDEALTPNDPRWQESLPAMPPEWLPSAWKGENGWPEQEPHTFADVDAWLVERQAWWMSWSVIASERFAAEGLSQVLRDARTLVWKVDERSKPPEPPQDGETWENVLSCAIDFRRWLADPTFDWSSERKVRARERKLNRPPAQDEKLDAEQLVQKLGATIGEVVLQQLDERDAVTGTGEARPTADEQEEQDNLSPTSTSPAPAELTQSQVEAAIRIAQRVEFSQQSRYNDERDFERDRFIYVKRLEKAGNSQVLKLLEKKSPEHRWTPITTAQGVRDSLENFWIACRSHSLPEAPRLSSGRPRKNRK